MMASSSAQRRKGRRILDYLNDGEELGSTGDGPSTVVTPRSPSAAARSLLLRFRWARISRLGRKGAAGYCRKGKGKGNEQQQQEEEEEAVIVVENGERRNLRASACSTATGGGGDGTRPTGLGVGLSLVFLLAKTSDEFSRMAKVRTEMETLLQEFKQQVGRNSTASDDGALRAARNVESAASSCLTADGNEQRVPNNGRTSTEEQATTSGAEATPTRSRRCCEKSPEDVLEEEFHAEFQRLQVNYGCSSDTPPLSPPEEHDAAAEPPEDISDYYHQRGGFSDDDDDSGEEEEEDVAEDEYADADPDDYDDGAEYNGVSAMELERRLHELLHQRNQERIEELEAALRRAERKLVERETEACMWKDTARLALRQDDDHDDDALQ